MRTTGCLYGCIIINNSKKQVLLSVGGRSLWVRAMRIFQLEIKTFHGWPLIELIFYSDPAPPAPSKKNRLSVDTMQHSPPHPSLLKNLLHQKVLLNFHTAPKYGKKTIQYSRSAWLSFAPAKKSRRHNRSTVDFREDLVQGIGIRQIILS